MGFFHVISAILHFITRQSKNVNKPGSYFSHQKCNSTNVHLQLEKITKVNKMETKTRLHQGIDEFYDNTLMPFGMMT